ncbi:MAG: winged helix-turn-helix transcriptional regulator [Alphaproteobacteria bacterium]|nr:winged helix-turn-helix transcriptional regulator [Alphaproteobacteria bacterium]MCB9795655.1 winged helix-turn-helix transcriptional regulator [Alphaproteobacteria bacterium]
MHPTWTFLTNHSHVLLCLARNPDLRIRDLADHVGITQRAVSRILSELAEEGYLEITKEGRRNHYNVRPNRPLRHPVEEGATVGELFALLDQGAAKRPAQRSA